MSIRDREIADALKGNAMSDHGKRALLGGAAIAVAMLLWVYSRSLIRNGCVSECRLGEARRASLP